MLKSLFIASLLLSSVSSFSQEYDPAQYIQSVEVRQVENPEEKAATVELPKVPANPVNEIAMYVDGLIAIGKKIWTIIDAGRPVINTSGLIPSISVLPAITDPTGKVEVYEMANWSEPKAKSYRVSYKNAYGNEVVGFTYTVYFQYNGNYQGKGQYITGLTVQASQVASSWGFNFTASSELVTVANVETVEDPKASAIIKISYAAKGLVNEMRDAQSLYVDGNGVIKIIK